MTADTTNQLCLLLNQLKVSSTNNTFLADGIKNFLQLMIDTVLLEQINVVILDETTTFVSSIKWNYLVCTLQGCLFEFKLLNHNNIYLEALEPSNCFVDTVIEAS